MDCPFTLGADPEFAIRRDGARHQAAEVFSQSHGYLGCDAGPTTGEMRPGYGKSPDELVARMYACFQSKKNSIEKSLTFHAGHFVDGQPLGGHLHCGWRPRQHETATYYLDDYLLMDCLSTLIDDLDAYSVRLP